MLQKAYIATNGPLKAILMRSQKSKGEPEREPHLLREYLRGHQQTDGRNMDTKGCSDEASDRNKDMLLETGGKAILVIKWK